MKANRYIFSLLAVAVLAAPQAWGQTVIKVGVINTYSGPLAAQGDVMEKGLQLYFDEHQKDLPPGVKIELVKRDDGGANPDVAKRLAQELVTRDHVQFLTGVIWSPNAAAMASVATEAKVPFVIMNAAGVDIPRLSPYIVRVSFTLWQQAFPLGKWAAQQGWKTAYTAVSDYTPGYDGENGFTKSFTAAGGQMVGTAHIPLANPDFVPYLQRVKDAKPEVLYIFVPAGKQATAIMKAAGDLDLKSAGITIVSTQDLVPDEELPNMGDLPLGLVTAGIYSADADRPANRAFLAAWKRVYGATSIPDFESADSWDGMAAIFHVVEQTKGKFTSDEAMAILKNWKDDASPRGTIMIDPATRDVVQDVHMRRIEKQNGRLVDIEFETIPMVKDPWKELNPPK
jgi:branched-chain amino acid transport system substrate-binding protein